MGVLKSKDLIVCWGSVAQDARSRVLPSGKNVTNFGIRYDYETNSEGRNMGLFLNCDAWGDTARYCAGLERGDRILVCGKLIYDDYRSKKESKEVYKINVEFVSVQPVAEEAYEDFGGFNTDGEDQTTSED